MCIASLPSCCCCCWEPMWLVLTIFFLLYWHICSGQYACLESVIALLDLLFRRLMLVTLGLGIVPCILSTSVFRHEQSFAQKIISRWKKQGGRCCLVYNLSLLYNRLRVKRAGGRYQPTDSKNCPEHCRRNKVVLLSFHPILHPVPVDTTISQDLKTPVFPWQVPLVAVNSSCCLLPAAVYSCVLYL